MIYAEEVAALLKWPFSENLPTNCDVSDRWRNNMWCDETLDFSSFSSSFKWLREISDPWYIFLLFSSILFSSLFSDHRWTVTSSFLPIGQRSSWLYAQLQLTLFLASITINSLRSLTSWVFLQIDKRPYTLCSQMHFGNFSSLQKKVVRNVPLIFKLHKYCIFNNPWLLLQTVFHTQILFPKLHHQSETDKQWDVIYWDQTAFSRLWRSVFP